MSSLDLGPVIGQCHQSDNFIVELVLMLIQRVLLGTRPINTKNPLFSGVKIISIIQQSKQGEPSQ